MNSYVRSLHLLTIIHLAMFFEGTATLLWLLMHRSEPQNALFLGYSLFRLVLMSGVAGITLGIFFLLRTPGQRLRFHCWLEEHLQRAWLAGPLLILALVLFPLGIWMIYQATDVAGRFQTAFIPLIPFLLWAILIAIQLLILLGAYPTMHLPEKRMIPGRIEQGTRWLARLWPAAMAIPGITILAFLIFLLLYGQPNSDEGWYLYAGQMVYRGQVLYQDFAYTQMPLLPYVYGLPQLIFPSYLAGRLTSFVLFILNLGMACSIGGRFAGKTGVFCTLVLFATYTTGLYSGIVVKTYILTAFFMTGTIFWLTSSLKERIRLPLAALFAICAALVRLSALGFALPVLLYIFITSRGRTRWVTLAIAVITGLFLLRFFFPNPDVAIWDLVRYHVEVNQSTGWELVRERLSNLGGAIQFHKYYYFPLLAITYLLLLAIGRGQSPDPSFRLIGLSAAGIAGFILANLAGGRYQTEYFIPGLLATLPLLVISVLRLSQFYPPRSLARGFAVLTLLAAAFISYQNEGIAYARSYLDKCPECQPLSEIHQVGETIRKNSQPGERVLAMEYLFSVVDAGRETPGGLSMAQFSITDLPDTLARRYQVVNWAMVTEIVLSTTPRALLLSANEQKSLLDNPAVKQTIHDQYNLVIQENHFGQKAGKAYLYIRK